LVTDILGDSEVDINTILKNMQPTFP